MEQLASMTRTGQTSNDPEELWQVELPYATFGIVVRNNEIAEAAPIGGWMVGKLFPFIWTWVARKKGNLKLVSRRGFDENIL